MNEYYSYRVPKELQCYLLEVLALLTWGLFNDIVFQNKDYIRLHSVEDILKAVEVESCLYIDTNDENYLHTLQPSIKNLIEYCKKMNKDPD